MPETPTHEIASTLREVFGDSRVLSTQRLTGGASSKSFRVEWARQDIPQPSLIFRIVTPHGRDATTLDHDIAREIDIIAAAKLSGVPAPECVAQSHAHSPLGAGYAMVAIGGETLPRRIFRAFEHDDDRQQFGYQTGSILGHLHATQPPASCAGVEPVNATGALQRSVATYASIPHTHPTLDLAFEVLGRCAPSSPRTTLLHGDFRMGNLMFQGSKLVGVLDWELAGVGDPVSDLGWLCTNSWRFGHVDRPVGGVGQIHDLLEGYRSAGGIVDHTDLVWWMAFGSLRWGVMCLQMAHAIETDPASAMERAAIGRRVAETAADLGTLLVKSSLGDSAPGKLALTHPPAPCPSTQETMLRVTRYIQSVSGRCGLPQKVSQLLREVQALTDRYQVSATWCAEATHAASQLASTRTHADCPADIQYYTQVAKNAILTAIREQQTADDITELRTTDELSRWCHARLSIENPTYKPLVNSL